ncbi:MAG: oxidoreductase, partial [Halobacteria archaeon]|nr:oxidoreductase [Halobacteria archaeon]
PAHRERLERLEEESCLVRIVEEGSDMIEETAEVLEGIGGRVYIYGFAGFVEDAEKALERAGYDGEAEIENFG